MTLMLHPSRTPTDAATAPSLVELVQAAGLTDSLPQRLGTDPTGQSFAPVQLVAEYEMRSVSEQLALVLRPEPIGGWAPLIHTNRRRLLQHARDHLHQRLATGIPAPAVLRRIQTELRTVLDQLMQRQNDLDQRYSTIQEQLGAWQSRTGQQRGGVFPQLAGWLLGGPGQLSLPQAISLWNERELLAFNRATYDAACQICSQILDDLNRLRDQLQELLHTAQRTQTSTQQQVRALQERTHSPGPWNWRVNMACVANVLTPQCNIHQIVADLLPRIVADGADSLANHVHALACEAAERCLAGYTLAGLIEAEASTTPVEGIDPLVVVGQALLEALDRQVPWQLVRTARPRSELLQITADGTPLYTMDGLHSAAYGADSDRIGFVQVQSGVALHDLRLFHGNRDAFDDALRQRNLYVPDDLAQQAAARLVPIEARPSTTAHSTGDAYEYANGSAPEQGIEAR